MSYTTIIKQDGTVTQDTTTSFTDGRIWKLANGESLRISDDKKIFKMGADGAKVNESIQLDTGAINKITLAVDRTETKACVIHTDGYGAYGTKLNILTIGDMSLSEDVDLTTGGAITPLRAIIDKTGKKIIWLGNDNKLYTMDLDGGNLESLLIGTGSTNCDSFTMDIQNTAFTFRNSTLYSIVNNTIIGTVTPTGATTGSECKTMFVLDGYIYIVIEGFNNRTNRLYKIQISNTSNQEVVDLLGLYTIASGTICQFNASGFDNFGTFFGKKDGVMRRWQVNLDNLECTPARWETYPTKQVFSNDTNLSLVDYSGVNGNNCDNCGRITSKFGCTGSI